MLGADSKPVPAFYAAGEVAGDVHGNNRLGGNFRVDCVVFGRVVGVACAQYMLDDRAKATSLAALAGGGKGEGSKKWPGPVWEEIHLWIAWLTPTWQAQHVPSTGGRGGNGFRHHQASPPHGWFGE